MVFLGLSQDDCKNIQYEVLSERARLKLTRIVRANCNCNDNNIQILRQNRCINIARNVMGLPLYVLEADDWGDYQPGEYAWHYGELELIMRRSNTIQLIEILGDLIQENILELGPVNKILQEDHSSVQFKLDGYNEEVAVSILDIDDMEETDDFEDHPNIRKLVARMDNALQNKDFSAVLHASASVFETMAKYVMNIDSVANQSLGGFFDGYRNKSQLPEPILDYILEIYKRRNTEPLAGHGSLQEPNISEEEAVILSEVTKTFIKIERKLAAQQFKA